jgi:hypothetical protein
MYAHTIPDRRSTNAPRSHGSNVPDFGPPSPPRMDGCRRVYAPRGRCRPGRLGGLAAHARSRVHLRRCRPNGALFAGGQAGVYRALPGNDTAWQPLSGSPASPIRLCAPSADVLFAIARAGVGLYRSDPVGDWTLEQTPISDSLIGGGDDVHHLRLLGLWCPSDREVFAVGERGTILRWDGRRWQLEDNPLLSANATQPASTLYAITGSSGRAFATSRTELLERESGVWKRVADPRPADVRSCAFGAVAEMEQGVVIGGGTMTACLVRWASGEWQASAGATQPR